MKRQSIRPMDIRHALRSLKYSLLFGTWPYLPAYYYYYKKLDTAVREEEHFKSSKYHRKFQEADQLIRYGQKLSLPQLQIVEALRKTSSEKVSIEALITGRFWRYQDGSLNFKPKTELLLTTLYLLVLTLCAIFFVGLTVDLISLAVPLWLKACVIFFNAAALTMMLFVLGFYSVVPLFYFSRIKDKIYQIEETRKLQAEEPSIRAKIVNL